MRARGVGPRAGLLAPAAGASAREPPGVLARGGDLPRAEAGAWTGWTEAVGLPDELVAGYARALEAWRARDFPGVLTATWPLLEAAPDHPALLHLAGHAQFRLRRYGECAALLARLVDHVPGQVGRTRHLAHAWNEPQAGGSRPRSLRPRAPGSARGPRGAARARPGPLEAGRGGSSLRDPGGEGPEHAERGCCARILVHQEEAEQALLALAQHRASIPTSSRRPSWRRAS